MTSRVSSARRPLSAIFIGDIDQHSIKQAQLPSPPSTNSQGSGSTADGDSVRDKRRTGLSMGNEGDDGYGFRPSSRAGHGRRMSSDEDDFENDGDHTAKLSSDRRVLGDGSSSYSRASSRIGVLESLGRLDDDTKLNRAHTLAARNRQMLDRLSSPATLARLGTPPPITSRSPIPRPPSVSHANGSVSRPPSTRPKHEMKLSISGSETERERAVYSSDDHSTPPSSATHSRFYDSQELQPEPSYDSNDRGIDLNPEVSHATERSDASSSTSHRQTFSSGAGATISRRRGTLLLDGSGEGGRDPIFADALAQAVSSGSKLNTRTSPHKVRNPLPREFRDRRSYDGRNGGSVSPEQPTSSRYRPPSRDRDMPRVSSAAYPSRDHIAYDSPTVTALANRSAGRSQTVRERRAPSHFRWASEDMHREEDEDDTAGRGNPSSSKPPTGEPRWRYRTRGGSAESALAGGGRSLIGEGLRAAGLTRRRSIENDDNTRAEFRRGDSVRSMTSGHAAPPTGVPPSSSSSSAFSEVSNNPQSLAMRRDRLSRLTGANVDETPERSWERDRTTSWNPGPIRDWDHTPDRLPRTPAATTSRFTPTIRNTPAPRPATSLGGPREDYGEIRLRPPPLRTQRSAVDGLSSQSTDRRATHASPPIAGRERDALPLPPQVHLNVGRHTPQSLPTEHPRLMLDALQTFENNLNRLPPHSNRHVVPDCIQSAQVIVRAAEALNDALRLQVVRALEEQIEAEVGGGDPELWKGLGVDLRDSLKQSDEIVRTLTSFLLGVGKVMRDVASASTSVIASRSSAESPSTTPSHTRAVSLSAETLSSMGSNHSITSGGSETRVKSRLSIEGPSTSSGGRRSLDGGPRNHEVRHDDGRDLNGYGENERRSVQPRDWERSVERHVPQAPRRQMTDQVDTNPVIGIERSATSMSTLQSRDRLNPPATSNRSPLPSSNPRLSRRPMTAPQNTRPVGDYDSPTPLSRTETSQHQGRRFPPPPLSTLPSESIVQRSATLRVSGSGNANGTNRRKISTGSTTTLRGHHHMPSLALPAPRATTQVSTMTVSTATEHDPSTQRAQRPSASHNHSFSISAQTVDSPVETTEYGQKRRTLSTAITPHEIHRNLDNGPNYRSELTSTNGQSLRNEHDSVRVRNGRGRTSLDTITRPNDTPTLTDRARDRRRPTTEPFR